MKREYEDDLNQMVKIKKINKEYDGPLLNMIHLRHLMLKTNGRTKRDNGRKHKGPI